MPRHHDITAPQLPRGSVRGCARASVALAGQQGAAMHAITRVQCACMLLCTPLSGPPHGWRQSSLNMPHTLSHHHPARFAPRPVVARTPEDIIAARGVKPTLSPNLSVLATVEALAPDVKRLLFIGVGCQVCMMEGGFGGRDAWGKV